MSKTKAGGSTRNGRDSESKRLGTKVFDGSIMVRQRGTKIHPGENVSKGGDDTLFSKIDGVVKFSTKNGRKLVNVIPK